MAFSATSAPPHPHPHARVSLEEREVHRIYHPWLSAHGSSLNVANHVDSLAQDDLQEQGYEARSSRDKALTAYAQLVALRLNVKRCMISLIDTSNQYILAEATRTVSMASSRTAEDDELWLGTAVLSRPDAICEHCFTNTCTAVDDCGATLTAKGLVVPDCRVDDRFKDRPYVLSEPGIRFYAGVPIYSRNGYMIGACAVSDDMPRAALKVDELRLMQETAQSVIEHLEWARDRVDRFKGERIVRGMASFIEGCTTFREDVTNNEPAATKPTTPKPQTPSARTPGQRPPLVSRNSGHRTYTQQSQSTYNMKSRTSSNATPVKGDSMSRMFQRAAEILRQSTLADGAAIFGATATTSRQLSAFVTDPSQAVPGSNSKSADGAGMTDPSTGSESERWEQNTSDSDSTPTARACKILAFSIADDQARADVESGSALTLGTLERYFALFPRGKTFSFTDQGSGFSSEEDSGASDRETQASAPVDMANGNARVRPRKRRMDHKELLKKIPGAKTVVFLPLYDHSEERLMAGCFLWTSVTGRMMSLDSDLSYLRAFGNCIISEVVRVNMQKNEAAKTTFIASMSHELRSPLHGILGAAEFLAETASDAYQSGLVTSIVTCGRTLLDTLNHVLDYSKINKLGRAQMRRHAKQNKLITLSDSSLESLSMTGEFDLGVLVEEVAEAVSAGHAFKKMPVNGSVMTNQTEGNNTANIAGPLDRHDSFTAGAAQAQMHGEGGVSVLLDVSPRQSWRVRTQPGALRRIIMNLLGNSLKYTSSGFVAVSLRAHENAGSSKTSCVIRIVDSGKGMSEQFQHDRMFVPFSQEDPFQPGTGLGLSIVKSIVDSLGGTMEVKSQVGVGTEIDVHLCLPPATDQISNAPEDELTVLGRKTLNKHLVLLEPDPPRVLTHHISRLEETIRETCKVWFGMRVSKSKYMDVEDADIYLYSEPPSLEKLVEKHRQASQGSVSKRKAPIIVVYMSAEDAIATSRDQQKILRELGTIVEVIPQPCGPRKLAKILNICLQRAEELKNAAPEEPENPEPLPIEPQQEVKTPERKKLASPDPKNPDALEPTSGDPNDLVKSMSSAVSYPSPPPFDPSTPSLQALVAPPPQPNNIAPLHALLVDDNRYVSPLPIQKNIGRDSSSTFFTSCYSGLVIIANINRQLLVMFMKKHKFSYVEAADGQEALDAYKASCLPGPHSDAPSRRFDVVLMDISMPVMDGMESTRHIREFEKENGLTKSNVIALTGLASAQAQQEAEASGIDVFMPKPVKFQELKKLLTVKPPQEEKEEKESKEVVG